MSFTKDTLAHLWGKVTGLIDTVNDNIKDLNNKKVDTMEGYSLISDTEIERLSTVTNYDDTTIKTSIDSLYLNKANKSDVYTKTETDNKISEAISDIPGGSSYAGTITSLSDLSTTAKKGEFYRVSTAWSGVHVNDIILAEKDNPIQNIDGVNWSLLHNEENTDESVTSVSNHYIPTKTETISAADGKLTDITNSATGTQVVTGVEMDAAGHITGVTSVALKASGAGGSGIDRYVNSASFDDDTTSSENNPLKMTLTRAGDNVDVVANLPKVTPTTPGVVPKGNTVTEQTTATKFLREDGTWNTPSYPTTLPASDTTDEYSSTGTTPVSGKAVAAAIKTLDTVGENSIDAGKTIASWNETDGVINITTQDISITKSQITDFPTEMTPSAHTHDSSSIDAMISYKKADEVSPISTTDSLNTAIGKLEKALDEKQPIGDYANKNHTHDEYVNQNAFSNITIDGSTTVEADATTDTLKIVSGNNITISADTTNDTITISATDTVYTLPAATDTTLGGVKIGNNITNTEEGVISVTSTNVTTALGYTPIDSKLKGANNGIAELGSDGIVPSSQLPTVDSTVTESSSNTVKSSGIYDYVNSSISTNTAYFRGTFDSIDDLNAYSGDKTLNDYAFVKSIDTAGNTVYNRYKWDDTKWGFEYALNNSSFTANQWSTINSGFTSDDYDRLKDVTDGATKTEASDTNGNIKINGSEVTIYTHPTGSSSTNPHGTTKSDVGLGNVGNFKAVSTVASQDLTDTEKSNARDNIGAGTSSFSGSYNDLSDKPVIDDTLSDTSTNAVQTKTVKKGLDTKVDKINGKGLSTNDFTDAYKNQVDTNTGNISTNKTNITTIAKHVTGNLTTTDFYEQTSSTREITVPSGMDKYAIIKKITGNTVSGKSAVVTQIISQKSDGTQIASIPVPDSIKELPDYGVTGNIVDFENKTYTRKNTVSSDGTVTAVTETTTSISDIIYPIRVVAGGKIILQNANNVDMSNVVLYKKEMILSE